MTAPTTIPQHLASRLRELGAHCAFGIVGDFALRLFGELNADDFSVLVTTDEQGAGFAADAFARHPAFGVVRVSTTEFFEANVFAGHRLDDIGAGNKHVRGPPPPGFLRNQAQLMENR